MRALYLFPTPQLPKKIKMTNKQSNFVFYSVICLTISGFLIDFFIPTAFDGFKMNKEELVLKEALQNKQYNKALDSYKTLIGKRVSRGDDKSLETANLYEKIADVYALSDNQTQAKEYYLKAIEIKKQLGNVDSYSMANAYYQLGLLAEKEHNNGQALQYFEQSLTARLADIIAPDKNDEGMFDNMQASRVSYLKQNHEDTIANYKKLAAIHSARNEYGIAKNYYQKALAASQNTFGEDDAKTLAILAAIKALKD